jgi:tRNA 2-(methylsulfanyl)-N6-isopentenyladenosine37 hydroxylase
MLQPVMNFLPCQTPSAWLQTALNNIPTLLIDHAHCEKKAASTAMSFVFRYPDHQQLCKKMSRFAREELRHFEQVVALMNKRGIQFQHLSPSRYAAGLRQLARHSSKERLVDALIIGAFVEARSCERFACLVPELDGELAKFYGGLLSAEARHFTTYLKFAEEIADADISERVATFAEREKELICSVDDEFRFHSGILEKL